MYILKCVYSDGGIVKLGTTLKQVKKELADFYTDQLEDEDPENEYKALLSFNTIDEINDYHDKFIDSDFLMEYI